MAVYHGKAGSVDFSSVIDGTIGWSMVTAVDQAEDTAQGDTWKSFLAGKIDISISVQCIAKTERTLKTGTEASIKLYLDDTNYFTVNALCVGETETADINDVGKLSYEFIGDASTVRSYA